LAGKNENEPKFDSLSLPGQQEISNSKFHGHLVKSDSKYYTTIGQNNLVFDILTVMSKLSLVATPIGNLEDITIRAIKTLFTADYILCEDTRHSGLLLQELVRRYGELYELNPDWKPRLFSYYDEIEEKKLPEVIQLLLDGNHVSLISDAGTPLVSDPGFRLVRECVKRNINVESIPGPSAVLTALTSSGLPADTFSFLGYPPEKQTKRKKLFEDIQSANRLIPSTYIFYCAPHKLTQTLEDLKNTVGDIQITIARELTKMHEEVWKGKVSEAVSYFGSPKGEFVLLFNL
jgi:16S rRNA (cytidine1402-2'-O)-methyltransferase